MTALDGETFVEGRDGARLRSHLGRVFRAMSGGGWWTLADLVERTGGTSASVSARLRDLRKPRFGGHEVRRDYVGDGVWRYTLLPAPIEEAA